MDMLIIDNRTKRLIPSGMDVDPKLKRTLPKNIVVDSSNTLVIHPKDHTTDCLEVIYRDRNWSVIRNPDTPESVVKEAILSHHRIIMLGHGTPYGLLAAQGRNRFGRYIINWSMVNLFKNKETMSIWCFSNRFFKPANLKGLHTGMIISELSEEWAVLGHAPLTKDEMAENMERFCGAFAKYIDLEPEQMREKVLEEYTGDDEVTQFNRKNIIVL